MFFKAFAFLHADKFKVFSTRFEMSNVVTIVAKYGCMAVDKFKGVVNTGYLIAK